MPGYRKVDFRPAENATARGHRNDAFEGVNLDAASAAEILTVLSRLNREFGKTVIMVTHDPHAAEHASLVHHLEKGRLMAAGA